MSNGSERTPERTWLQPGDRVKQAEAWDAGHDSATMRTAQELLALLPQRTAGKNPHREVS